MPPWSSDKWGMTSASTSRRWLLSSPLLPTQCKLCLHAPEAYKFSVRELYHHWHVCTIRPLAYRDWTLVQYPLMQVATVYHSDRVVVVNATDGSVALVHAVRPPAHGRAKWKVAPRVGLLEAQITPPWASMIDRAMASPMPMPAGFVV